MPRVEPTKFECQTCGWKGEVQSSPVHCVCGTISRLDGEILRLQAFYYRPGDVVEKLAKPFAKAVGLEGCGGCGERRKAMNAMAAKLLGSSEEPPNADP